MLPIHTKLMSWMGIGVRDLFTKEDRSNKKVIIANKKTIKYLRVYTEVALRGKHDIEAPNFDKTALSLVGISQVLGGPLQ